MQAQYQFGDRFESKAISVRDVNNNVYTLTLSGFGMERVFDQKSQTEVDKEAVYFKEAKKYLLLNDTNYHVLIQAFGPPQTWAGNKVEIFVDWSVRNPSGGDPGGVRLRVKGHAQIASRGSAFAPLEQASTGDAAGQGNSRQQPEQGSLREDLNDNLPF
ncbi:hypothetical protein I6F15_00170 [Bradyrhizobium sp. BRP14]|nr:hypothetical protein [Bradyrhizobium sp. BRP14]